MSELIRTDDDRATIRWKLLTGVSAIALTAYISSIDVARAGDPDSPQIWIEFGGQMQMMQGTSSTFNAPFFTFPQAGFDSVSSNPLDIVSGGPSIYGKKSFGQKQAPTSIAIGGEGTIIFQPVSSDWIFSASVNYGRSHDKKHTHYQGPQLLTAGGSEKYAAAFSDSLSQHSERHTILDFQAGKDVGLGLFGHDGTSTISAGVRFAQFSAKSSTHISARPYAFLYYSLFVYFHQYALAGHQSRSFKGIGPSLSWNASTALAGNKERGELTLDWGIEGAMLFGRQKAKTDHATHAYQLTHPSLFASPGYPALYPGRSYNAPLRSRNVIVPDVSGFIGLSAKLPHSKITIGYKGDIWFGAVDRGIDSRKISNLTFNGPYASISIGLGD